MLHICFCDRLRETTVAWSSRVQEMEGGAGLDQLRPAALKKLLAILKVRMTYYIVLSVECRVTIDLYHVGARSALHPLFVLS